MFKTINHLSQTPIKIQTIEFEHVVFLFILFNSHSVSVIVLCYKKTIGKMFQKSNAIRLTEEINWNKGDSIICM